MYLHIYRWGPMPFKASVVEQNTQALTDSAENTPHACNHPSGRWCDGCDGSRAIPRWGASSGMVNSAATYVVRGGVQIAWVEVVGGAHPVGNDAVCGVGHVGASDITVVHGDDATVVVERQWKIETQERNTPTGIDEIRGSYIDQPLYDAKYCP
ncbi:hypothetical protein B0H15DRAFT_800557 [Mycena belliarum]|uniref:Uncharacterized protein n=1 Tax=Mycena belliarum TaxID=1033014 RepID=A0AAD6U414_9AGAR|nr:hypothetical protein B0H15DRAFT_800557 [Mycena belliae]